MDARRHWDEVYATRQDEKLSWFQAAPTTSLALVDAIHPRPERAIDIGGGQSLLAGELVSRGFRDVVVLDISGAAVERARARLGALADRVRWIVADVLDGPPLDQVDLWHDRAVFHFLTGEAERRRYVELASRTVAPGGHAVVATFAPSGPERCSGLPVRRHDAAGIAEAFGAPFRPVDSRTERHVTPWGAVQDFTYALLQRSTSADPARTTA